MLASVFNASIEDAALFEKINTGALHRAMKRALDTNKFTNFVLFSYKSGIENNLQNEELIPGSKISIDTYVRTDQFRQSLISNFNPNLDFNLWSRKDWNNSGRRQLMLSILPNKIYINENDRTIRPSYCEDDTESCTNHCD
jgi:hypothetical protein